jgi:hypothetical protein
MTQSKTCKECRWWVKEAVGFQDNDHSWFESQCWRNPHPENRQENHFCSEFTPKKKK